MPVYESNPNAAPDREFEPGELRHLVVGNTGRLLDPRRTPVSIVGLRPEVGAFVVRIEDFEDRGALWEIPFERVCCYQFARGGRCATESDEERYRDAVARFDRPLHVACNAKAREATLDRLETERADATAWLASNSAFFGDGASLPDPETRTGDPRLQRDLRAYMEARGLWDVEEAFARQFVSGPHSGELVKAHRIVIAELGLVAFEGTVVRDPSIFDGAWSRERRGGHVLARMGFVRAMLGLAGRDRVVLYRGMSSEEGLEPPWNVTFVSSTFSRAVAESHFESGSDRSARVLLRQAVPVERVFMTYLETAAMNQPFKEAEAVLLFDAANRVF